MSQGKVLDVTKELKRAKRRAWIREKYENGKRWCADNPQLLAVIISGAISLTAVGFKSISTSVNLRKEEHIKNEYCYDRSLGHYWELRRKLTNDEWVAIDKRKKKGERLADILDSLKVLK